MRDEYPYLIQGHMYQYDLHWIVENIQNIWKDIDASVELHTIKYADPIQWDITTQYQANTVVVDPKTGTAYISTKPVPSGILLTDTNYWTVVFNFQKVYTDIMKNISAHYVDGKTSTFDLKTNELVWFEDNLYYALHDIDIGDALVPDANIKKTTVEDMLKISFRENMLNFIGGNRTTTLDNDILNVSGDWTVQAGDITQDSNNLTATVKKDALFDFNSASARVKEKTFPITFPDKVVDLYNSDSFNVKEFGAVGDGVTDDSNAIQNCMDAAMVGRGGCIVFPAGTYAISKKLIIRPHTAAVNPPDGVQTIHFIPMDRIQIRGEGEATLKAIGTMDWMIETYDFSYPDNKGSFSNFYTHIYNLKMDGNGMATGGIHLYNALHSMVHLCQIFGVESGINIDGYGDCTLFKNTIKAHKAVLMPKGSGDSYLFNNDIYIDEDGIGFEITGYGGSTSIVKNTITPINSSSDTINNQTKGIMVYNNKANDYKTGPLFIHENSFDGVAIAVHAFSDPVNFVTGIEVYHNKFANLGNAKTNLLFEGIGVNNCLIVNNNCGLSNEYTGATGGLVSLTKSTNCEISGNLIPACNYEAIKLYDCTNCFINSNKFNSPAIQSGSCIKIEGKSLNNVVKNNMISKGISNITRGILEIAPANYNTAVDNYFKEIDVPLTIAGASSIFQRVEYGYNKPKTGTWIKGDRVYNQEPYADSKTLCWVCTESGTPGTWGSVKWIE